MIFLSDYCSVFISVSFITSNYLPSCLSIVTSLEKARYRHGISIIVATFHLYVRYHVSEMGLWRTADSEPCVGFTLPLGCSPFLCYDLFASFCLIRSCSLLHCWVFEPHFSFHNTIFPVVFQAAPQDRRRYQKKNAKTTDPVVEENPQVCEQYKPPGCSGRWFVSRNRAGRNARNQRNGRRKRRRRRRRRRRKRRR